MEMKRWKVGRTSIPSKSTLARHWEWMPTSRHSALRYTCRIKTALARKIGNQRKWVLEAIRLLSEINGGATAMPPVEGGWLSDHLEITWKSSGKTPSSSIHFFAQAFFKATFPGFGSFCTG